jgi:hypothetical protein
LHTLKLRLKGKSNRWEHHLYRWANGVPLTDSDDALKVSWCELTFETWERLMDFMMRGLKIGPYAVQKS